MPDEDQKKLPALIIRADIPRDRSKDDHRRWEDQYRFNELQKEQWDEQEEVNEQNRLWRAKYEEELRNLRDAYVGDKRLITVFWHVARVGFRWSLYVAMALGGWAWNHWDKLESLFPGHDNKS